MSTPPRSTRAAVALIALFALICGALLAAFFTAPEADASTTASERPVRSTVRVVTQNVRALPLMPQEHVVHDVTLTASQADVVLWQEVRPTRYLRAVRALPGWRTYTPVAADGTAIGGAPVSWRQGRFQRVDAGYVTLHSGVAKTCLRRTITWVKLRDRITGVVVVFSSRHYVAGAWSTTPKPNKAQRQAMWNTGNRIDRQLAAKWVRAGFAHVAGGDWNSRLNRLLVYGRELGGRAVRYYGARAAIDTITVQASETTGIREVDPDRLDGRYSDHAGRRITFALFARPWRLS